MMHSFLRDFAHYRRFRERPHEKTMRYGRKDHCAQKFENVRKDHMHRVTIRVVLRTLQKFAKSRPRQTAKLAGKMHATNESELKIPSDIQALR